MQRYTSNIDNDFVVNPYYAFTYERKKGRVQRTTPLSVELDQTIHLRDSASKAAEPRLGARGRFGGVDCAQPELVEGFKPPSTLDICCSRAL